MGGNSLLILGLLAGLGIAIKVVRLWNSLAGGNGNRARIGRIATSDAHLSFDERLAERLRELEKEQVAPAAPPAPPREFGRRQV